MRAIDAEELKRSIAVSALLEDQKPLEHIIDEQPTIEPERKNGRWLQTTKHYKDDEQEYDYIETTCSVCGVKKRIGWTGANYCPNCGSYNGGEE